jgi:arginyl-tRNA synthetase
MEDIFRQRFAREIASALYQAYTDKITLLPADTKTGEAGLADLVYSRVEIPKDRAMGDYAFPTFWLAGIFKEKPNDIAAKIHAACSDTPYTIAGAYINTPVAPAEWAAHILPQVYAGQDRYGDSKVGQGRTIVIDYSSPNIAKPFGVGHLRSTAIGNSLYRILKKLGYRPIGINHLGDWGTQFGKMIVAYRLWGDEKALSAEPIKTLFDLYVRFHTEEEKNPALADDARAWFKKLEDGDPEAVHLWTLFRNYSLEEFKRIYEILGVSFDYYTGESFYNDRMDVVIDRLQKAGLAVESQGALIVDLEKYGMSPCLLKKADDATLYATRDLAGIYYRHEQFDFYKALYVVGGEQKEHFKQVFKVIELLGEPFADRLVHVDFGWIRFKDQAMSTRKGNIVILEEVIKTAVAKVRQIIMDKNPDLPNLEKTAQMVGVGAVIFSDLSVRKQKDVNFSWEEVLNFEGGTGPYLQYTHARLTALIRKYGKQITDKVDFALFRSAEEKELLAHLYRFGQVVEAAGDKYEPNFIAEYLLDLAAVFNRFYQRKDDDGRLVRIISDNADETAARMLLVSAVRTVLREGLRLLGIDAPEEM